MYCFSVTIDSDFYFVCEFGKCCPLRLAPLGAVSLALRLSSLGILDEANRVLAVLVAEVRIHACACIEVPAARVTTIDLCGRPKVSDGAKTAETAIVVARRERGKTEIIRAVAIVIPTACRL